MQAPKELKDAQDIANTLDTAVKIPFLGLRVGLDFLIGLIPGVGDAIVLLLSWRIVYLGRKMGSAKTCFDTNGAQFTYRFWVGLRSFGG